MNDPARGPLPVPTEDSEPFWAGCRAGELRFPRCGACGLLNWFPRRLCRGCSSDRLVWSPVAGTGSVYSFSVVRRAPGPDLPPVYVLALVDVDDGPRVVTHVDCPPEDARIGMPVSVRFDKLSDEISLPVFVPIPAGTGGR